MLDKPAGLIVHRDGRTEERSVAQWLAEHYPALCGVGGEWVSPQGERIALNGLVHRLDRTTSGIVLAAKSDAAFQYLKNEFKERRVEKKYLAYVYGHMGAKEGEIVAEIMRTSEPPKRWYARDCGRSDKRAAITHWRALKEGSDENGEPYSLVELEPKTGRTHQLRVHLAHIGHPIVADHLYAPGKPAILGFSRPALHALSIRIAGQRYEAPLPPDFRF